MQDRTDSDMCKTEQIQTMKSSVKTSVEESVKAEFVSYSTKLQSKAPVIPPDSVRSVVKTVMEEEDRSQSVMLFGLEELDEEQIYDRVNEVFGDLGEKPRFEAQRLGKRSSGDAKKVRPVKVNLPSSAVVTQLLKKARNLRQSEKHKSVFISPDKTPEERATQRKLVEEMKKKAMEEPEKRHFIRRGAICSVNSTVK